MDATSPPDGGQQVDVPGDASPEALDGGADDAAAISGGGLDGAAATARTAFAQAYCARTLACSPPDFHAFWFGTMATCVERTYPSCALEIDAQSAHLILRDASRGRGVCATGGRLRDLDVVTVDRGSLRGGPNELSHNAREGGIDPEGLELLPFAFDEAFEQKAVARRGPATPSRPSDKFACSRALYVFGEALSGAIERCCLLVPRARR